MSYNYKNALKRTHLPPGKKLLTHELDLSALKKRGVSNLKILRRSRGLTLEGLSAITGISPSYLSRLECGARRLNTDLMEKLSSVLNCTPSDLLKKTFTNVNERETHENLTSFQSHGTSLKSRGKDLPVYAISTGISTLDNNGVKESADLSSPVEWHVCPLPLVGTDNAFGLLLSDGGYAPKYNAGDVIYVHPSKPFVPGCTLFVALEDESVFLRTFCDWHKESIIVRPLHSINVSENQKILKENIKSVYKVVGSWSA